MRGSDLKTLKSDLADIVTAQQTLTEAQTAASGYSSGDAPSDVGIKKVNDDATAAMTTWAAKTKAAAAQASQVTADAKKIAGDVLNAAGC